LNTCIEKREIDLEKCAIKRFEITEFVVVVAVVSENGLRQIPSQ